MRPEKELDEIIAATIKNSGGAAAFTILARDREEFEWLANRLKGKHGAKFVGVRLEEKRA